MKQLTTMVALAGLLVAGAPGHAADVCTWGGTPLAPTGTFWIDEPGIANSRAAATPIAFWAEGPLEGATPGCTGTLRIDGTFMPGSYCRAFQIWGTATGVPSFSTFWDVGGAYSRAVFYDAAGNIAGSYGASVVTGGFADLLAGCAGSGIFGGDFSATVEIR